MLKCFGCVKEAEVDCQCFGVQSVPPFISRKPEHRDSFTITESGLRRQTAMLSNPESFKGIEMMLNLLVRVKSVATLGTEWLHDVSHQSQQYSVTE